MNVELLPPVTVISVEVILPLANFSFILVSSKFDKSLLSFPSSPCLTNVSVTSIPLGSVKLEFSLNLEASAILLSSESAFVPSSFKYEPKSLALALLFNLVSISFFKLSNFSLTTVSLTSPPLVLSKFPSPTFVIIVFLSTLDKSLLALSSNLSFNCLYVTAS